MAEGRMTLDDVYMLPLDYIDGTRIRRVEKVGIHRAIDPFAPVRPKRSAEAERLAKRIWRAANRDAVNERKRNKRAAVKSYGR
jgi:hypothetical protein